MSPERATIGTATLLVSPAAGAPLVDAVRDRLGRAVEAVSPVVADSAEGSRELARRAVEEGTEVLVVLGGDGLAHLAVQACAGSATALAVVPAGTGNDLARALGMPSDPLAAAEIVASRLAEPRLMDLGGIADGNWFATVLCAGFDAAVNACANRLSWPRGRHRYDVAIVTELARLRPFPLVVDTPDARHELEATLVAVGNTDRYGGGIPVCPDADATDGLLDVTIVGRCPRRDLLRILPSLRTGRHIGHPAVTTLRARALRLAGEDGRVCYADGDPQRRLPLAVRCEPGALRVVTADGAGVPDD